MKKIKLISLIALASLLLVFGVIKICKVLSVRESSKDEIKVSEKEVLSEIEKVEKNVLVAENSSRALYINPSTLNVRIEDKATGKTFDTTISGADNSVEKSLLVLNYVGKDNSFYEWNTYDQVVETDTYTLYRLNNGVRINMHFDRGASTLFYEYLPKKMTYEHYELFTDGIEKAVEEGRIEKTKATKYKNTLKIVFFKSKENECYSCKYNGNPPYSACVQLIDMANLVGYTREMLLEDSEKYGFTVTFKEPAAFNVTLDFELDGEDVVVSMPADLISSENDYYSITNIEFLPNFYTVTQSKVTEGYLFVPDGSGALMAMNTYNPKVPDYKRPLYNNDFYTDYSYKPEYETELMLPVFGSYVTEGEMAGTGLLGIVESGADYSWIEAMLASNDVAGLGRLYNKIYCSYDSSQYEWVPIFGEYADDTSTYLSVMDKSPEDLVVRYKLYVEEISYYDMARNYGEYLAKDHPDTFVSNEDKVFLEVYGTLSIEDRILGIPYEHRISMTGYSELQAILEELGEDNVNISYLGVFDGGKNNMLMNRGRAVSANGSKKELETLRNKVEEINGRLFFGTDFMRVWDTSGNGFLKNRDADQDYTRKVFTVYGYSAQTGKFLRKTNTYMMLKPSFLISTVRSFLSKTNIKDADYYVAGLTKDYYADYGGKGVTPLRSQKYVEEALDMLSDGHLLALDSPRGDRVSYGTVLVDIPRNSSEYASTYCTIPFYQLAVNGLCEYTATSANNTSYDYSYFVMQALETGAQLKFTVCSESVDILRASEYSFLYSIQYDMLKDDIRKAIDSYKEGVSKLGNRKIVGHTMLEENVFRTDFENGAAVITNYTGIDKTVDNMTIPAEGFVICK